MSYVGSQGEAVAIGLEIERVVRPIKVAAEQSGKSSDGEAGGRGRTKNPEGNSRKVTDSLGGNSPKPERAPETTTIAATAVSMTRPTYEKAKESRDKRIFDLWLACWSNEEIGTAVGMTPQGVGQVLKEAADLPNVSKPSALHQTDFTPPIYNIWKQQEKTPGARNQVAMLAV